MAALLNLILYLLAQVISQGLWCSNSSCSTCLEGFNYKNLMCLSKCPTGYITNSSICQYNYTYFLFNFEPGLPLALNAKSVNVFNHPQGLEFRDKSRLSPIMTKDRGLYFANSSRLISNTSWILAPDFSFCFSLKIVTNGTIFQVGENNKTYLRVYGDSKSFSVQVLFNTSLGNKTETFNIDHIDGWFTGCFIGYQQMTYFRANFNRNITIFLNYEFRGQVDGLVYSFGGENGTSF